MWLCLNDAFVSVVQDKKFANLLCVRARKEKHLRVLFPDKKITKTMKSDYRWRTWVSREEMAKLVSERVMGINYGNFKNSVMDDELHGLYAKFWQDHWRYQNYGRKE